MNPTITPDQQQKIIDTLNKMPALSIGVGTAESACSVAAINLALTGELTDRIPDCMSSVIGRWIIKIQDYMPADLRNSPRWRALLPLAAGTGREYEKERLAIIMNWMWEIVLPQLQPLADKNGFGEEWRKMYSERTKEAAFAAYDAACSAYYATAANATAANAAAANAARAAANAAAWSAYYATAANAAAANAAAANAAAANAARAAANAAANAAAANADKNHWTAIDPCGLLEKLIKVNP